MKFQATVGKNGEIRAFRFLGADSVEYSVPEFGDMAAGVTFFYSVGFLF